MNLRVATYNLKGTGFCFGAHSWKKRRELLRDTIAQLNADLIGVQELTPIMKLYLSNELSDYNFVGKGRGGPILDEHSDIAVRNGIGIEYNATFPLAKGKSGRYLSIRSPLSWIFPRICTIVELKLGGKRIRMFNTHLDVSSESARIFELKLVCRRMEELNSSDPLPTILTGDFNASPNSRAIQLLKSFELPRLSSVSESAEGGTYHFFKGKESNMRIDHVFASPEFSVVSSEIVRTSQNGVYPSDHYPLLVTLSI